MAQKIVSGPSKYQPALPSNITPDDLGDIVQAACLAHDLGNPPFGHAGEEAIIHWFDQNAGTLPSYLQPEYKHDIRSFEGNAQGFRVVTQLENHIFEGGLRLTYATLGAFQKYPWTSSTYEKKFGAYLSEREILNEVLRNSVLKNKESISGAGIPLHIWWKQQMIFVMRLLISKTQ